MQHNISRNRMGNRGQSGAGVRGVSNDRVFDADTASLGLASSSAGPLMTGHLQLHDLDLELALLKRKREIIEKQQNMLRNEPSFSGSSQMHFDRKYGQEFNQNRNFSNFYDDSPEPLDRLGRQRSVKRSAVDVWETGSAPKRFGGPPRPRKSGSSQIQNFSRFDYKSGPSSFSGRPTPLMGTNFSKPKPTAKGRTDYRTNKVTKSKNNSAPNKLNSYAVNERKSLIAQASQSLKVAKAPEVFILKGDIPPSPKLLGRLELALGSILQEMKQQYGSVEPHNFTFQSPSCQRAIKQAIRDRIRTMMTGKVVGVSPEIVTAYRKEHPKETDIELLTKVREASLQRNNNLAIDLIETGNPEKFFKLNFNKLVKKTLKEMLEKLQEQYKPQSIKELQAEVDKTIEDLGKEYADAGKAETGNAEPSVTVSENEAPTEPQTDNNQNDEAENVTTTDNNQNNPKVEAQNEIKVVEGQNDTNVVEGQNETQVLEDQNDTKVVEGQNETQVLEDQNDTKVVEGQNETQVLEGQNDTNVAEDQNEAKNEVQNKIEASKGQNTTKPKPDKILRRADLLTARFYTRLIDTMLKRNLPQILPRFKEHLVQIINADENFRTTKAFLIQKTNEMAEKQQQQPLSSANEKTAITGIAPFYVKIVGRPDLPRKKLMKTFLDKFNPKVIKKHRNMHNVLFVAFDDKENYNDILTKTGTMISNCKLEITVSEKITKNKKNDSLNSAKLNDSDIQIIEDSTQDTIVDVDMADQISELLSSIREEETKINKPDVPAVPVNEEVPTLKSSGEVKEEKTKETLETNAEVKIEDNKTETVKENKNEENAKENGTETDKKEKEDNIVENKDQMEKTAPKDAIRSEPVKGTPTRSSSRLASVTPSTIKTRRASKLAQNN